jgi:two-component system, LytTR family, response regulator
VKALIVDDERIARQELRRLLQAHPEIEVCGEARTGEEAMAAIHGQAPDVLFLDIHMPGMTAFELLEKLDDVPQVIFTTAFDSYALRAFDAGAIDYLVKPVAPNRLKAAICKLRFPAPPSGLQRVFVKEGERCWLLQATDIYLLESEGNYTRLYFGKERALIPRSLAALEHRLDASVFFRTSRRHIVNLKWVESVGSDEAGGLVVKLKTGVQVEMSRRRAAIFRQALSL